MSNPFATEAAWAVSDGFLGAGDHAVEIRQVTPGKSSGGYEQVEVHFGNDQGSIRDWIVVIDSTIGKVIQLLESAGLERPSDEQVEKTDAGWLLDPAYLDHLVGKRVGVLVRSEPDMKDPTKTRDRIKSYVPADAIGSDATSAEDSANPFGTQGPGKSDDDLPF